MGKNIAGVIVGGLVGALIGGAGVYIYFNKIYDVTKEREFQEYEAQIDELQKRLAGKNDILKAELVSSNDYEDAVSEISESDPETDIEVIEEDEDDENDGIEAEDLPPQDDIRFIGPGDYDDDDDYEKETIKYYSKDDILTQDDEILEMEEFEQCCGNRALGSFGKYGASANEVFVRNEHFGTDYKIKRYNMSYERYINASR